MVFLVGVIVIMILFFILVGVFFKEKNYLIGLCYFLLGDALLLVVLCVTPDELPSGSPRLNIISGEYNVGFVYPAGDNVTIGLEFNYRDSEYLRVYQFDKKAFDGDINVQAKKLVVVEARNFRKLELK